MNYQQHYDRLIERGRSRKLEGYKERHHVIPTCLGGTNEKSNIVELTPNEHYVAHQLLVKLYPGNSKIAYAAINMTRIGKSPGRVGNKLFGWLRKQHAANMSIKMLGNTYSRGQKLSEHHMTVLRQPKSEEHKRRISEGNRGKTKGLVRGPQSEEHKRKLAEARRLAWARKKES